MALNIFDKLTNDAASSVEKSLGRLEPTITIFDSKNSKEIKIKPKVLRIASSGAVEISRISLQSKGGKSGTISDNIVARGNEYEITIFETENLGLLEWGKSTPGKELKEYKIDENNNESVIKKSAIKNLIEILDNAKINGFELEYKDGFETINQLYIVNNPRVREPKDNDKQIEIRLSVSQVGNFKFENKETKTTNISKVEDKDSFPWLASR